MSAPDLKGLMAALAEHEREARVAIERLRDLVTDETEDEVHSVARHLRGSIDLVSCLRRFLPGRTLREIHDAFGAPGDWGYETPIGDALARLYRSGAP